MDIYKFSFYLGFTGLAAMLLLGAANFSQSLEHHGLSTDKSSGGDDAHPPHLPEHAIGSFSLLVKSGKARLYPFPSRRIAVRRKLQQIVWSLLSPRVFFSFLLGFGAVGVLLPRLWLAEPWRFLAACGGGTAFEVLLVAPLWNFTFRFASNPARTLDSMVCEEAKAVTNFDAGGNGLIALDLDGQVVQVLGVLAPTARGQGVCVHAGDRLFIEAVDTKRNSCTVSLLN